MKNTINILVLLFVSALIFSACEEDDDADAQPVVSYVRPTEAAKSDSLLVSASMGQTIAIIGENLQDVQKVLFNDRQAKLNPVYVTGSSIIVTVPGEIPEEITNTMTLETGSGKTATYNFGIVIPSPDITSVSCEWAPDGDEIILYGDYFFPDSEESIEVLFPGNMEAEVVSFTDTEITAIVPDGAFSGYITVTNDYGTGRSSFTFRDETGIFIDGESPTEWNNWGLSDFASEDGLDGTYLNFEGTTGSWQWPANSLQLFYVNPTGEPLVTDGEVGDYALKFEYYCHEWHDTPMLIWFSNEENTHDVDADNAQYHWEPYDNNGTVSNYTTEGWRTMTMPLSDFVYNKDESETSLSIPSLNKLVNLNMMWFGAVDDASTEFGLKIWIDNIRLVKVEE